MHLYQLRQLLLHDYCFELFPIFPSLVSVQFNPKYHCPYFYELINLIVAWHFMETYNMKLHIEITYLIQPCLPNWYMFFFFIYICQQGQVLPWCEAGWKNKIAWRIIIQPLVVITSLWNEYRYTWNAIPCLCSLIYHSIWCQLWVKHAIRVHCPINKSVLCRLHVWLVWIIATITLSGTLDFIPFGEFMISPIHYIYSMEFVSIWTMFMD